MEEEFYATVKLTSGEEVVSQVCYDPSDDVIVMINPKLVKKIVIENRVERIEGFELISWIKIGRAHV